MSARAILAVTGSLAAHAAALATLAYALAPVPPPDQPLPKTRMTIAAQQVKQTTAPQADNAGETAAESDTPTAAARQGTVRQAKAAAAPLVAAQLAAAVSTAPTVQPAVPTGPVLAPASPAGPVIPPQRPNAPTTTATPLPPPVKAAEPPRPATVTPAKATAATAATLPPDVTPAAQAELPTQPAQDQPLPARTQTAALAWSGAGSTQVSAESLAAIAAFSQEGDLSAGAKEVRDGIAGILASVSCARLQTTFDPATGDLKLTGHIPEDALRGPVLAALRAQVGDAIPLSDSLLILPRPQCGALAGIADAGLPQSTEQLTNPRVIGEDGFAQTYTYSDGQPLQLDLEGPDYDSFVYVDYFVADGSVIHLQPNDVVPLEPLPAKAPMSVGRDRGEKPFLLLTVGAPFGQEIAAAFATSVPLYDGLRPVQEPAAPYLAFLKEQVAAARAAHPDFKGEWVYFFITTTPE